VPIQSEELWTSAREAFVRVQGGRWPEGAARAMTGMSSIEWSRYLHDALSVSLSPERNSEEVSARMESLYIRDLPLIEGAPAAVARIGSAVAPRPRLIGQPILDRSRPPEGRSRPLLS